MKKGLTAFLSVFMLAVLAACGSTEGEEIELSETSVKLNQNETMQIDATVLPDEEDVDQTVTWESSDEDVVVVNQSGEIGGKGGGTATVTVTSDVYEDLSAELDVTVLPMVDYVAVEEPNLSLTLEPDGSEVTHDIQWEVAPMNDQTNTWTLDDISFTSSDEDVVTVDGDTLTAHGPGSTQVRFDAGDEYAYFEVSVSEYSAEHTLADVKAADEDVEVETYGVVNNIVDHRTIYIEDGTSGLAVYDSENEGLVEDVEVGDKLYINGLKGSYEGLEQIVEADLTIVSSDNDLRDPVNLNDESLSDDEAMIDHLGLRADFNHAEITSLSEDDYGNINVTLESIYTGESIAIRYDSRLADSEDAATHLLDFSEGDIVNISGMTIGWYQGAQLLYTSEDEVSDAGVTADSVSDVLDTSTGEDVSVRGVVTNITDHATFFIEDATGAIAIYDGGEEYLVNDDDTYALSVGDVVEISGERDSYNGLEQVSNLTDVNVVTSGYGMMPVQDLADVDLNDESVMEDYLGHRVSLEGFVVDEVDVDSYGNITLSIMEPESDSELAIDIATDSRHKEWTPIEEMLNSFSAGSAIDVTGASVGWSNGPELLVGAPDQVAQGELTTDMIDEYLTRQMDVPEETSSDLTLEEELTADETTYTVTWASDNEDVIDTDGTVTQPAEGDGDATVTLTATIADDDEYELELDFEITVPEEEAAE